MPLALVARVGNAMRLVAVDRTAHALGLVQGIALADARARCPTLITQSADPPADARELARLVNAMVRFTPMVAADPPDGIILDITGCDHLFGGAEQLTAQVLSLAGYSARTGLASNAVAARALARHGTQGSDVHALPVAALDLPGEALSALHRAGLRHIGDLARRPMAGLAARFGADVITRLRQMLGEVSSPITPHHTPPPIRHEARFAEPLARTDDMLDVIEDLLAQAARTMEERGLGGRRFRITLHRSDHARQKLEVETGQPVRDPAHVMRLIRDRIDALSDPLDPGFGFDAISLIIPHAEPLARQQMALDGQAQVLEDGLAALIDRLGVRFGVSRVQRLMPCDRHLPETAQVAAPVIHAKPRAWPVNPNTPPRPMLLFTPPQPVDVIAEVPDGPPKRFRWRGMLHEVTRAEGPERIASEWWQRTGGEHTGKGGRTRDYYRVEDRCGRRIWIFRHGLYEEVADPGWYVHGLFA